MASKHKIQFPNPLPGPSALSESELERDICSLSERLDRLAVADWSDAYSSDGDYLSREPESSVRSVDETTALADIRNIAQSYPQFRPGDFIAAPRFADGSQVDLPIAGGAVVSSPKFEAAVTRSAAQSQRLAATAAVAGATLGGAVVALLSLLL